MGRNKPVLLIVDDDETILNQLKWALSDEYEIFLAEKSGPALKIFQKEQPPLVALDLGLPPNPREASEGLSTLEEMLKIYPQTKVLIITGNMEKANALKAVESGAYDYFSKPVDLEELRITLRRGLRLYHLEQENIDLQRKLLVQSFGELAGQSDPMLKIFSTVRKVAKTDAPVLITGESGTGKELVANAIHQKSLRPKAPFVVINCGAIPGELLESELFGHEKGAFTGAHIQRKGKVEFSQGGTLFLDEIAEMPIGLQVKLLRFLQDYRLERVGGRESIQVETRIIAASNADMEEAIRQGNFREDLYYRLSVIRISVPPLRKRGSDILFLANLFFQRYAKEYKKRLKGISQEAYRAIEAYSWPGNVRELENKMKRAIIMTEGIRIIPADLELPSNPIDEDPIPLWRIRQQAEKDRILEALGHNKGNVSRAAADLGISRPALYELMEKLGIQRG